MSDYDTGGQAPPPQDQQQPSAPAQRGGKVPVWVIVAVFVAVAVLAGAGTYWLMAASAQQQQARLDAAQLAVTDLSGKVDELSQAASQTAVVPTTPPPAVTPPKPVTPPAPAKPATTKEWVLLTGGGSSGGKLFVKADYIYFYKGAAAVAAQAHYGGSLRPDGTYIRNTSPTIKTLPLSPSAKIYLVEWLETGTPGSSWKLGAADPTAFAAVLAGTASSPSGVWSKTDKAILLTIVGGTVTRVEQYSTGA
jgi:hypothetical protein